MSYAIRILIGAVALVIVAGATAYRHTTATARPASTSLQAMASPRPRLAPKTITVSVGMLFLQMVPASTPPVENTVEPVMYDDCRLRR